MTDNGPPAQCSSPSNLLSRNSESSAWTSRKTKQKNMTASCRKKGIYIECISSSNASVTGDCLSGYISPRAMYLAFILVTNDFSTSVPLATGQETEASAPARRSLPPPSLPAAAFAAAKPPLPLRRAPLRALATQIPLPGPGDGALGSHGNPPMVLWTKKKCTRWG